MTEKGKPPSDDTGGTKSARKYDPTTDPILPQAPEKRNLTLADVLAAEYRRELSLAIDSCVVIEEAAATIRWRLERMADLDRQVVQLCARRDVIEYLLEAAVGVSDV